MRMLLWLITALLTTTAAKAADEGDPFEKAFSEDSKYFQPNLDCDVKTVPVAVKIGARNRHELVQLARRQNLLGTIIPNPICTLINGAKGEERLHTFVRLMIEECRTPRNPGKKGEACRLPSLYKQYGELRAHLARGEEISKIALPKDWHNLDFASGNWAPSFDFGSDLKDGKSIPFRMLILEAAMEAALRNTVVWIQKLPGNSGMTSSLAAAALSQMYAPYVGMQIQRLYEAWECLPQPKAGLRLDRCGIRRDIIYFLIRDAIGELRGDSQELIDRLARIRGHLGHDEVRRKLELPAGTVVDPKVARLEEIVSLHKSIENLREAARRTSDLNQLSQSPEAGALNALLTNGDRLALSMDFDSDSADEGTTAYRSFTEVNALLGLIRILDNTRLSDPEISRAQYEIWSNGYLASDLRRQIRDYLREKLNIVDAFIDRGTGT